MGYSRRRGVHGVPDVRKGERLLTFTLRGPDL
jgi:hypothetical protein